MNKKELWNIFMKTGKVADYIKYKNATDDRRDTEAAEEIYIDSPYQEEFDYDDTDGRYNN